MSTTTRRERRELERTRRERRSGGPSGKRAGGGPRSIVIAVGIVVVLGVLIAGGRALGVFSPPPAPTQPLAAAKYDITGQTIGTHEADESNAHIPYGQKTTYKTDPPTSGTHWNQPPGAPVPWGVKDATIPNEGIVHNLEHGGIVIFYKDLTPDELSKLRELARTLMQNGYPKIVVEPYALTDSRVALSAWRWSLKLPGFDDVQIVKFVKAHYEGPDAPEPQTM